jgi:hypothetical protein
VKFDQSQRGLLPVQTIAGFGVADPHFAIMWAVALGGSLGAWGIGDDGIGNEWAIPAAIHLPRLIEEDVWVEIVEANLPRLIFAEERIRRVLVNGSQPQGHALRLFDHPPVEDEIPGSFPGRRRADESCQEQKPSREVERGGCKGHDDADQRTIIKEKLQCYLL